MADEEREREDSGPDMTMVLDDVDAELEVLSQKVLAAGLTRRDHERLCGQIRKIVQTLRLLQAMTVVHNQEIDAIKQYLGVEDGLE